MKSPKNLMIIFIILIIFNSIISKSNLKLNNQHLTAKQPNMITTSKRILIFLGLIGYKTNENNNNGIQSKTTGVASKFDIIPLNHPFLNVS